MIKKIVASDIDGTLLPFGQMSLDPKLYEVIRKLREKDVLFVPASGRTIQSLFELFEPVRDAGIAYLSENGSVVWLGETPIAVTPIPKDVLEEITLDIYETPGMEAYLNSATHGYIYPNDMELGKFLKERFPTNKLVSSLEEIDETPVKLTAYIEKEEDTDDYFKNALEKYRDELNVMKAGPDVVDFNVANKGYGLKILADYFNLKPEDIYAFGDNYNDVPMLKFAGNSYIMRTDDPELLNSAKYVCDDVVSVLEELYESL